MDFEMKNCTWSNHPEYDRGFEAGQQSKQAEIDALKSKIEEIIKLVADYTPDYWLDNMIQELLE